jgi:hypothetical protein
LVQNDFDAVGANIDSHAYWMPYQLGQAAKTEAALNVAQRPATTEDPILKDLIAAGKTAPRITMEHIESVIVTENYFTAAEGSRATVIKIGPLDLLTFCVLTLANGYTVTGQSACASPENFDAEAGRKYARIDAIKHVWPLEGYLLKQRLFDKAGASSESFTMEELQAVGDKHAIAHERDLREQYADWCSLHNIPQHKFWADLQVKKQ